MRTRRPCARRSPRPALARAVGVAAAIGIALFSACGPAPAPRPTAPAPPPGHGAGRTPAPVTSVTVRDLGPLLPKALVGTAAAALDGRIYVLGGSGPTGFNAQVYAFTPPAGTTPARLTAVGQLPRPLHDAGAAASATGVLLCGGGRNAGHSAVYHIDPGGKVKLAGRMPRALSDLAGVAVGGRPYCLGGWTGRLYSDAVYDVGALDGRGASAPVVAHLPHAVRYGAAVAAGDGVLVAGGQLSDGKTTADLQWVPLDGAGTPAVVGHLPVPLSHAMGASLDGTALTLGGCGSDGTPVAAIDAVAPSGTVTPVGRLPAALCYASAASLGGAVYVFGGKTAGGQASPDVWRVVPGRAGG